MSMLRAIHVQRRAAGLETDDEAWRSLLERMTGGRSAKGLTKHQSIAVLDELKRLNGDKSPAGAVRPQLTGPYAKKIQALWIACYNLRLVDNRDDTALNTFAVGQAGVDHVNWVADHKDGVAVIEALKKMMERKGVTWARIAKGAPAYTDTFGCRVATAQWRLIVAAGASGNISFEAYTRKFHGKFFSDLTQAEWITLMNNLGRVLRNAPVQSAKVAG